MKRKTQIATTIIFPVYLLTVLFTDISLAGYWTDVILSVALSILVLKFSNKITFKQTWLTWTVRTINYVSAFLIFGILGLNLINPFSWDVLKTRTFYFQEVDG